MNFFSRLKKSSSLIKITLLYHIIILIIACFIYYNAISSACLKTEEQFNKTLLQVKNYIDSELKNADKIFSQIALINNIQYLYTNSTTMGKHQLYYTYKLIPNLKTCVASNNFIENAFIYFPSSSYIVSGGGTFDSTTVNHWFNVMMGFDEDTMMKIVLRGNETSYIPINLSDFPQQQDMIAYIRPIYSANSQHPRAVIIIFIKQSEVLNKTNDLFDTIKGNISVISKTSDFIFNKAPDYLNNKQYSFFTDRQNPNKLFTITDGEIQYIANNIASDIGDWDYILSFPKNIYYANINKINNMVLICIIIYLILSYILSYYFYKSNYMPIQRIISICSTLKNSPNRIRNELTFIEDLVKNIINENKDIRNILEEKKNSIKDGILNQLITIGDSYDLQTDINGISGLDLYFNKKYFFIIILYLECNNMSENNCCGELFFKNNNLYNEVTNGFKDIDNVYCIKSKNKIICISNTDIEFNYVVKRAKEICTELSEKSRIAQNHKFSIAVSSVHYEIDNFSKAYTEALKVMEYKIYMGNPNISFYEEICINSNIETFYTNSMETKLKIINQIKSHKYESAKALINNQINDMIHNHLPLPLIKCQMYEVINLTLSTVDEVRNMYGMEFMRKINITRILLDCRNILQLQKYVTWIFNQAENYTFQKEKEFEESQIQEIVAFINDNFRNPDMSLKYLSQVYNKDESYISSNFKKYMGIGYLDYLHSIRIREAKRLMIDDSLQVKDISYMVGYNNDLMLIRVFKRYEGVTPTQFRHLNVNAGLI